ncbi:TIM barrel protein [uncultured Kordia sp.]|uniref:sugar phosphate isomerase/epimerase family protein n=1 Tax=uncultured Kordia sp. TaxID=507699 RepID=UPI00260EF41A|nr:TIM barrel protein [uncultured Kordia sp.]
MKSSFKCTISLLFLVFLGACTHKESKYTISVNEVSPWCIIGFDSQDRTPQERITMLKQMGLSKYGFNRGKGDLSTMKEEFKLAQQNDIEITSIFLWLNAKRDSIGKLSSNNQELLVNLAEMDHKPTVWISFSDNFFEKLSQEESIEFAIEMIKFIKSKADELGCKLALYNHHGWFGNPHNQVEILERLNQKSITMVYNFHHAHEYVDEFPSIVKKIKPYLSYVNLNGVKKEGPQILAIDQGDHEFEMIKQLIDEGFKGPWGILGHIKTEDVEKVLLQNINGLKSINAKLKQEGS